MVQSEIRVEDRVEEVGKWEVVDTDAPADTMPAVPKPGSIMPPPASAIPRMQEVRLVCASLDGRAHEAWMRADIHEPPTRAKDPGDLGEDGGGVVEVGVCQDRDDGVERGIGERQPGRVSRNQHGACCVSSLLGHGELVGRDIDADERPAEAVQYLKCDSRSATEVETSPWSLAQQALHRFELDSSQVDRADVVVVPIGQPVVPRCLLHEIDGRSLDDRPAWGSELELLAGHASRFEDAALPKGGAVGERTDAQQAPEMQAHRHGGAESAPQSDLID